MQLHSLRGIRSFIPRCKASHVAPLLLGAAASNFQCVVHLGPLDPRNIGPQKAYQ